MKKNIILSRLSRLKNFFTGVAEKIKNASQQIDRIDDQVSSVVSEPSGDHFFGSALQFRFAGALIVYVSYLAFQSLNIIYLVITGFVIALALEGIILLFQRKMPRLVSIFLVYSLFFLFLLSGFVIIIPFLADQSIAVGKKIVSLIQTFQYGIQANGLYYFLDQGYIPSFVRTFMYDLLSDEDLKIRILETLNAQISGTLDQLKNTLSSLGSETVSLIGSFVSSLAQFVIVLTLSVFFSLEKRHVADWTASLAGKRKQFVQTKMEKVTQKLGFRLNGQLLLCVYIGVITFLGLGILKLFGFEMNHIVSLALIAGLMEFLPYIGPLLGAVPALIVAGVDGGASAFIAVALLFFGIQWTENNVLIPWVMNKTLGVSPLLILICMLIGSSVLGFLGILLAIPLAVVLTVFFETLS